MGNSYRGHLMTQKLPQTLTIDSPFGPREILAPAGWDFNSTDARVWSKLLDLTRNTQFKTKRDEAVNNAQIEVLANVLANCLGMAAFYWVKVAREFVEKER